MVPAATRVVMARAVTVPLARAAHTIPTSPAPHAVLSRPPADINGSASYGLAAAASKVTNRSRVHQSKEIPTLAVGDTVRHTKFGEGRVLAVEGSGDKTVAKVRFGSEEKRLLLLRYAPLEKVS